jgi:hypothetical protein
MEMLDLRGLTLIDCESVLDYEHVLATSAYRLRTRIDHERHRWPPWFVEQHYDRSRFTRASYLRYGEMAGGCNRKKKSDIE